MSMKIDSINQKILRVVQTDAKHPIAKIAEHANISTSPCHKRIKQLENDKVILNYAANIDLNKVCDHVMFVAEISLSSHSTAAFKEFENLLEHEQTMIECYEVSGAFDYLARFICRDVDDFKEVTDRLMSNASIKNISSTCILSKVKKFSGYPLKHLLKHEN